MRVVSLLLLMIFVLCSSRAGSVSTDLSVHFKSMPMVDAILYLSKFSENNVVVSSEVTGTVSLALQAAPAESVFFDFLEMHDLATKKLGKTWYVAPRKLLLKQSEDAAKWIVAKESSQPLSDIVLQMRYARAEEVADIIQGKGAGFLSKRGHVHADKRTNTLCLQDTKDRLSRVALLVKRLDVPVKQIMIDARLASVDQDCERELGLTFSLQSANRPSAVSQGKVSNVYSLAVAKLANQSVLDVKLAALERQGKAELISRPKLFTANQQSASIEAGEEVPYQETSEGGGTAIAFKKAVLGLKVTPQVLPNNKILLQIQINQDRPSQRLVQGVPTISTRQITTNVLAESGKTIVLGGIYESVRDRGERRIPLLSDLPILGTLFTVKRRTESKRELLVFVTPSVII